MPKETEKESTEQLDKALTDLDVIASDKRSIFRVDADTFRFQDVEYKLIENHRDAFDLEMMEERFTDYLFKYDYIVGDIAYEKLRLRGFFDDDRKSVPIDMKISNLEDYLIEYCNFGCQYFVFERVEKKEEDPEPYFKRSKKSNRKRRGHSSKRRNPRNKKPNPKNPANPKQQQQNKAKEFKVKKKETTQTTPKQQSKQETKKTFKIRKKKD